ncbi:MAG: GNAT family N-acetyltransferase, partial [Patescibacteria group bacterium]
YRQEGIGYQLLSTLIEEGKKAGLKLLILHCFENNDRALHLYEKLGFKRAGLVPGVYAYKGTFVGEVTLYLPL